MLYFSKLKLITIYSIIIILSFFSFLNFFEKNDYLLSKKVNLGLDLQGGSYLLLEVDSDPLVKQKLQNKLLELRKILKEKKIKYKNLKIINNSIVFNIPAQNLENFKNFFLDKENSINIYYNKYRSHEMDLLINENLIKIN